MPLKSIRSHEEMTVVENESAQRRYGTLILNGLVHAVGNQHSLSDAEAVVTDISRRIKRTRNIARELVEQWLIADDARAYRYEKFTHRKCTADAYATSGIEVVVADLEGEVLAEGTLAHIDYANASMALQTVNGESTLLDFAREMPVPEGLNQNYYGHEVIVALGVTAFPTDKHWILHPYG